MSTVEVTLPENTTTEETEVKDTEISEEQEAVVESPEGAPEGDIKETEDTPEISEEKALETEIKDQTKAIEDATTLLSDKGINYEALTAEYDTNGSISAESYAALEKAGFPASVVNAYIAGVEATQNKIVDAVYRYAGGQAEYEKVTAYIQAKGKEDVDSFNALIDSGNVSAIKMVIAGAKAEMTMNRGTSKATVLGGGIGAPSGGYANEIEMAEAMADPRYSTDEVYRKQVATKLSKSAFISFNN
jgi:hypothetical protein